MNIIIRGQYQGQTQVELSHPSGAKIVTAAPADNGGDGSRFSPTDLAVASLGSCILTIMSLLAEREKFELRGASFEAEKVMATSPRRIGEIRFRFTLPAHLAPAQRKKLEHCVGSCPVRQSLRPDLAVTIEFEYR